MAKAPARIGDIVTTAQTVSRLTRPGALSALVRREAAMFVHPKLPEYVGLATGVAILLYGYRLKARHDERERLRRIEAKLDDDL